jgi:glycolate oxidase
MDASVISELRTIVGPDNVLIDPASRLVYEFDGGFDRHAPDVVVIPASSQQVVEIVRLAYRAGVPVVPRGAGTGLAGGAVAVKGGMVLVLTRLNRILCLDLDNGRALVEPGVVNLQLNLAALPHGYFYAPDPSSQRACTIGGNIANNSGGLHCLAYGVTTNHVLGLEVVLPDGTVLWTGDELGSFAGYDLTGVLVGSEGTMGVVTKAWVKLTRLPETARLVLALFTDPTMASAAISAIVAAGMVPAALEFMDGLTCRAVEASFKLGFPEQVGAAVLIELDGLSEACEEQAETAAAICNTYEALEVRTASDEAEKQLLWSARKGALGAMGRIAPNYYLIDTVVPRSKLTAALSAIYHISREYDLPISNVAHAGDGNLHPLVLFDQRSGDHLERTLKAARDIVRACVDLGGTLTGEHGVGFEKRDFMPLVFSAEDLMAMARLRWCFDPNELMNPHKVFPEGFSCGEVRDMHRQGLQVV